VKRVGLSLLFVTGLSLAGSAHAGELLTREEVARCKAEGRCTILGQPSAATFDDGDFYGASGYRVVAVILPCRRGAELYIWTPRIPGFRFTGHLDGYTEGQLDVEPYASIIARAVAPLQVAERPVPPAPTAAPPPPIPTPSGPPDALDRVSRSFGITRLQVLSLLLVGVACTLLVLAVLVELATRLLTTLSEIYAKQRVISHASSFLHTWKTGGRR
jgi:hypothetical protein